MAIPDLNDRSLFPPFVELPEDLGEDGCWLLAQIKDDMTITKPTLVLTDRDGHPFALVFDGLGRDGLDLAKLGLKKGATAVVRNARQSVPVGTGDNGPETMTSKAAKRPFVRIAAGQAQTVHAVPAGLEQTLAAAGKLRTKLGAKTETCDACGSAGDGSKLLRCTGCSQAQYCNRACQTKGWSDGHKGECKAWRALTTIWA
ncbi:zinc mynd-type domain containing protein [Ophiostoma piceae UAMH 11346]|uniref:Zinc mynd-type domain containing protein n=1 Tax=Ophiostoma piceae (strain UAMH 11346) TaxID=1262450 RepID=S3CNQ1_OPHP1|nr:zinc mynd-type domain containing protein [Ophiostoma piceae UAMH 11346]